MHPRLLLTALLLTFVALAACSGEGAAPPLVAAGTTSAATSGTPAAPSVVDLMARAGCDGTVIAPQLHTREVGRCTIGGREVDVAVFDTNEQRDAWAEFARNIGGTVVTGELWAVGGIGAAGPDAFAAALAK